MAVFRLREEESNSPTDTIAGFWLMDADGKLEYINWYEPGHFYFIIKYGRKRDGSVPNKQELIDAQAGIDKMDQGEADEIELYHEAPIKRQDGLLFCAFATFVPKSLENTIKGYIAPTWKYLGETWCEAREAFNNDKIWLKWWPKLHPLVKEPYMDEVVSGRESAGDTATSLQNVSFKRAVLKISAKPNLRSVDSLDHFMWGVII